MKLDMGLQQSVADAQAKVSHEGGSALNVAPVGIGSVAGQNSMHNDAFQSLQRLVINGSPSGRELAIGI